METLSKAWELMSEQHRMELDEYGFSNFKRHQNFKYFNWNWEWRYLFKEQMRFLLSHSSPLTILRSLQRLPPKEKYDRSDSRLYNFAVRLLWEYAKKHDSLGILALPEPLVGNPLPIHWEGRLISQDLASTALELNAVSEQLLSTPPKTILEIGAGYGRTAYALLSRFPQAEYVIVDIEPAISISRQYLTALFPDRNIRFLSPEEFSGIAVKSVSFALSISSLQEMKLATIKNYLDEMNRTVHGFVYLKQWTDWFNPFDKLQVRFAEYPIPQNWVKVFSSLCPVQTTFSQACWSVE